MGVVTRASEATGASGDSDNHPQPRTSVSGSSVYTVIHGLITNLETAEEDLPAIKHFKVIVAAALKRRWSFDEIDLTTLPALLSVLDPRFKVPSFFLIVRKSP